MKALALREHEVRRLLAERAVSVWRPVPQQPVYLPELMLWSWPDADWVIEERPNRDGASWVAGLKNPQSLGQFSPFAPPGLRRWIQETWQQQDIWVNYRADDSPTAASLFRWRPSTQMSRWASRLTVECEGVRCVRLEDMKQDDALATGAGGIGKILSTEKHAEIWDGYNKKPEHKAGVNPWCWVGDFVRVENGETP